MVYIFCTIFLLLQAKLFVDYMLSLHVVNWEELTNDNLLIITELSHDIIAEQNQTRE